MSSIEDFSPDQDKELNALLNEATSPVASDGLKAQILDLHARTVRLPNDRAFGTSSRLLNALRRRVVPAGAFAGLGALGFAIGLTTAPVSIASYDEDALYYAEVVVDDAFAADNEGLLWAAD